MVFIELDLRRELESLSPGLKVQCSIPIKLTQEGEHSGESLSFPEALKMAPSLILCARHKGHLVIQRSRKRPQAFRKASQRREPTFIVVKRVG